MYNVQREIHVSCNILSAPIKIPFIGVASNKAEHKPHTNNMHIPFFSYLIIGATSSKRNEGTNHNKQLTPVAELNNKPITDTTRVLLLRAPSQLIATFLLY